MNAARGSVIDEQALIAALRSGKLAAAGLDVYKDEPDINPDFRELDNAFLLPHRRRAASRPRYLFTHTGKRFQTMNIGFIGLGIMGAPMAGHLQQGGHELHVVKHRSPIPGDLLEELASHEVAPG